VGKSGDKWGKMGKMEFQVEFLGDYGRSISGREWKIGGKFGLRRIH